MGRENVFFAYGSGHQDNRDAITKASDGIKKSKKKCKIIRWEDLSVSGNIIGAKIFDQIKNCDIFACDLTYLNHNVLFELGFAIAQQKKLKIFLNPHISGAKQNYSEIKILTNIGYAEFSSAREIIKEFQKPSSGVDTLLIDKIIPRYKDIDLSNDIFLINIKNKNQAAIELEEFIPVYYEKFITNNEDEIDYRPLVWYLKTILKSRIVLLHMVGNDKVDFKVTNAEYSLYAGLAYGLGKDVLMIAPYPFRAPIDYTDILIEYSSSEDCVSKTVAWIKQRLEEVRKENGLCVTEKIIQDDSEKRELNLLRLGIGEGVADKDNLTSAKTFVEIDAYLEATKRKNTIITGRKGSGKTEIFMRIKDNLDIDKNNYNIIIKPDSDELLSNVELSDLYNNERSKKAFLRTVWEYVISSKIFKQIYVNIDKIGLSDKEIEEIKEYYNNNEEMFNYNFYSMILYISRNLQDVNITKDPSLLDKIKQKLLPMKNVLRIFFNNKKYQKINILADNLDTGWEAKSDLELQSLMIVCLLEFIESLNTQLGDKTTVRSVVFLRKDILNYILENVREPDKMIMDAFEINWEKYPNQLKTVIDKRIQNILENNENIENVWSDYFSLRKNENPFDIIQGYIVKRPRDVIYFISRLFESAVNNNKLRVTDDDLSYALEEYTKYLHGNLIAEMKAEFPVVEKILRELQRVYSGILTQFTLIPLENFNKILQIHLRKEETDKLIKKLMENDYLVAIIKKNNQVITNYDDLLSTMKEKKLKIFRKNRILLNMKLIPFAG